jgi:hypothetical protein
VEREVRVIDFMGRRWKLDANDLEQERELLRGTIELAIEQIKAGHPDWARFALRDVLRGFDLAR